MPFPFPWLKPSSSQPQNTNPNSNPSPNPFLQLQNHFSSFLSSLHDPRPTSTTTPPWARLAIGSPPPRSTHAPKPDIEERLGGVPVYALANAAEEFVLVSGARTGRSLGLFCFRKEDANSLLAQMGQLDDDMGKGSRVVALALDKVFQLKVDGVAFRFIPDSSQVANAIQVLENSGYISNEGFPGVPVFQSRSLVLRSNDRRYRPVFFRKEDLDDSLLRTARDQRTINPTLKGEIQVTTLEEIINTLKDGSTSIYDDVVFIPPGFNLSTNTSTTSLS